MNTGRNFSNDELDHMLPFQQNGKFRSIDCVIKSNIQDLEILIDSYVYQLNEKMESYEITEKDCDYLVGVVDKNIKTIEGYIEKLSVLNDSTNKILVNYKFIKDRYVDILVILVNYSNSIKDYLNEAEIINSIKELEGMKCVGDDVEDNVGNNVEDNVEDSTSTDEEHIDLDEQLFVSTNVNGRTREGVKAECEEKKDDFLKALKTASAETIERFVGDVKIMYDDIVGSVNDIVGSINDKRNTFYKLSEILDYYEFIISNYNGYGSKSTNEPEDHPVISHIKKDAAVRSVDNLIDSYASLLKSVYSDQTKF